jgi:hypothetical protein
MTDSAVPRFFWVFLVLLGCGGAYGRARDAAEESAKQRRFVDALVHYEQACALSKEPGDETCKAAQQMRPLAENELVGRYEPACSRGDAPTCIDGLAKAPPSIRDNMRLRQLRKLGGKRHYEACLSHPDDLAGNVKRARCVGAFEAAVNDPDYTQWNREVHQNAAGKLVAHARGLQKAHPAASVILFDAAQSLAPADAIALELEQATQAFLESSAAPLRILLTLTGPDGSQAAATDICPELQASLGHRVRCHASGPVIRVEMRAERIRDRMWTENHSQRYQAGVEQIPNPAYDSASDRVDHARRAVTRAEEGVAEAVADCRAAEREWAETPDSDSSKDDKALRKERECDRAQAREDNLAARQSELRDAESDFRTTDMHLERPVFDTHHWTSRHFEWSLPYAFTLDGFGTQLSDAGTVVVARMEQEAFPPANVPGSSVGRPPRYHELIAEAHSRMAQATLKMLTDHLTAWGQSRVQECPAALEWTGPWLECQAEAALWSGQAVDASIVLSRIQ